MNREAERKRLVEVLESMIATPEITCPRFNKQDCKGCQFEKGNDCDIAGREAGYLLNNGIIAPTVEVGQTVYVWNKTWRKAYSWVNYDSTFIKKSHYIVADVVAIIKTKKQTLVKLGTYNKATYTREYERYPISAIGKTVFTSREQAEQALKGEEK